ncbi:MAG: TolC family protein [Planctomycetota bacterium]|jgi:outer membrane protein TolC
MPMLSGCKTQEEHKQQADDEVYSILDRKWQPEFGVKANYRVSDVPPEPNDIILDPNWVPSGQITLAEAVSIATSRNRDYQSRKESLYSTTLDLTAVRHEYATRWFGSIDGGYSWRYNEEEDRFDETVKTGSELGFNKLLADGTQISTSIALDWIRYLSGDPETSLGSVLTSSISKPLLQGSTKEVVQENLTQAERNVLYAIRSFSRFRKEFVVSIVNDYLRTLQSLDRVENAQSNYQSLQASYEEAALKAKAGKLPPFEADQTEQQMLQARDSLAQAQRQYQQILDSFKLELAVPVDANIILDSDVLEDLASMQITEPNFLVEDAVEVALKTRLDLATAYDGLDDAERKVDVAEDALRARLDLVASASVESTENGNRWDRLEFDKGTYDVGMVLDLPLDKLNERNVYRRTLIAYLEAKRDYELAVDEVKLEVRNAYRSLIEAAQRYHIQKNSLALAQERVNSTTLLLQAGRVNARDLLDSQNDFFNAQDDTTTALVNYMLAKLDFYRDVGILTVKPDGSWESLEKTDEKLF